MTLEKQNTALMRAILQMEEQGLEKEAAEYKQKLAYQLLGIETDGEQPNPAKLGYHLLGLSLQNLPAKTPKDFTKSRPVRGGRSASYVEVGYVKQVLNSHFLFWDFIRVGEPRYLIGGDYETDGRLGLIILRGRLTVKIPTPLGWQKIVKESVGEAEIQRFALMDRNGKPLPNGGKAVNIGDDEKAAESDALKRCASYLGIAADVYWGKDEVARYEGEFSY